MSRDRRLLIAGAVVVLAAGALAAAGTLGADHAGSTPGGELEPPAEPVRLQPSGSVLLEEPGDSVIAGMERIAVGPRGRIAVPDREIGRVHVYAPDGELLRRLGRPGEGPGEFLRPLDVAFFPDGSLFVSETGKPRITRFTPDLRLDTLFRVTGAMYPSVLAARGDRLYVYVNRPEPGEPRVWIYDGDGRRLKQIHPSRPEYETVPYWTSLTERRLAVSGSHLVAGGNLLLPLAHYDVRGQLLDSLATEPPGWKQPPRPERGRFAGPGARRAFERWRRRFTTLDRIGIYRDSLLVLVTKELDPDVLSYEEASYRAHFFRIVDDRYLGSADLPGPVLQVSRHVHVLLSRPPAGWRIGRYRAVRGLPAE